MGGGPGAAGTTTRSAWSARFGGACAVSWREHPGHRLWRGRDRAGPCPGGCAGRHSSGGRSIGWGVGVRAARGRRLRANAVRPSRCPGVPIRSGLIRRRFLAVWGDVLRLTPLRRSSTFVVASDRMGGSPSSAGERWRGTRSTYCRLRLRPLICHRGPLSIRTRPAHSRSLTPTTCAAFWKERASGRSRSLPMTSRLEAATSIRC